MEGQLIKTAPDKEKAKSILKMAETTLEMIQTIDLERFPSNAAKEYYDVIRELISVVLLLDGYKTYGEGAHKKTIEYLSKHYKEFTEQEISTIEELRILRNRIAYDGFFLQKEYLTRKEPLLESVIQKLRTLIKKKVS
ncbi:MAG: hypothetical protein WAX07_02610 [Candidatus Altiarchaeia archaeon]|jgi:hypothetical protein